MFNVTSRVVMAGSDEFITFLVVAGIVIAQVVRAIKKAKKGPSPAPGQTPDTGQEQELQTFLQRLAGGQPPQAPPTVMPVAPPPQSIAVAQPRVSPPTPRTQSHVPHAPLTAPPPAPRPAPVKVAATTPVVARAATPSPAAKCNIPKSSDRGSNIAQLLSDPASVRDMVVLREILGPPLALRGTDAMTAQR